MNAPGDGRVYLCRDVAAGDAYDFDFQLAAPASGTGSLSLAVRMVRDGVQWFGESRSWSVAVEAPVLLPDVVVTAVPLEPPRPAPGQPVTFRSIVRNDGAGSTPAGTPIGVGYFVDGVYRTWGAVTATLAPGASVTVTTQGGAWSASSGSHQLTARVDDVDRFAESDENNNDLSMAFEVGLPAPTTAELYGINIDPANPAGNPSASTLRELGARAGCGSSGKPRLVSVSMTPSSRRIGPRGRKCSSVDYASVPGSPPSNASDGSWRGYITRFVSGTADIASHYGDGVDAWQIWNEQDLFAPGSGYDPGIRPELYAVMLRDTAAVLRARSTRPIVTGGLASGNPGYLSSVRAAIGGLPVDAVAVHPYGQRAPDNWPSTSWGFGNMSTLFDRCLAIGRPLWVTEIGPSILRFRPTTCATCMSSSRVAMRGGWNAFCGSAGATGWCRPLAWSMRTASRSRLTGSIVLSHRPR